MKRRNVCKAILIGTGMIMMSTGVMASRIDYSGKDTIKIVQEKLNAAGFDCGTPDGIAGSGTATAIQKYREANGLTQGEAVDAELFNALTLNKEQNGFIKAVEEASKGNLGEGETLEEITLYNGDLCLAVDLGDLSKASVPAEELAYSRVSSLTDAILELENFEHLWETITVDFGDLGEVVNDKDNMKDDGYGKYFDSAKFQLSAGGAASGQAAESAAPSVDEAAADGSAAADEAASSAASGDGVTPEVKEALDAYEAFMNKYCDFMENYDSSDLSAMVDYLSFMSEYADFAEKIDAMDEASMTDADYKYYIDVLARVEKRMIDVM